jgi:hypothetical protein
METYSQKNKVQMNRENLQRAADYIRTVPQEMFHMGHYRAKRKRGIIIGCSDEERLSHECNTVGCAIGHCTALDSPVNLPIIPKEAWSQDPHSINFTAWSEKFFDIPTDGDRWAWCFSCNWSIVDNTPEGAALRIEWLLKNGLPINWRSQMHGTAPLCYKGGDK